ncbi:hypothetical protein [Paraburkholderia strydomiana]|uniref:hypothetical protein n=1 Tax=Paraburkholderia strydomiana TaxID=1245417 RepID=UPI0038B9636A
MDSKEHWEGVYRSKASDAVSWYRPHLETSVQLICEVAPDQSAAIIDVGGGESTLADDLLVRGYRNLTVLDMSAVALNATKQRLGSVAEQITRSNPILRWSTCLSIDTTCGMTAPSSIS